MVSITSLEQTFQNKKVLITGNTGFKGSWLSLLLLRLNAEVYGYALEPKGPSDNFVTTELNNRIHHKTGDVRDLETFKKYVREIEPDFAFHLAAQPLVLESYQNPAYTFETNVMGVVNFFEAIRYSPKTRVAINITSDKCYRNNEWIWGYRENEPMGGDDPYSASKGCAELITHSYSKSFFETTGCIVASARAGNVIGGGDWAENRIVPDLFRALKEKKKIQIRNPLATRPWQFVLEPLVGYLCLGAALATKGKEYQGGWNFGPLSSSEKNVEELVCAILSHCNEGSYDIIPSSQSFHEAHYLKLDISKAIHQLKWKPALTFKQTIAFTTEGYLAENQSKDLFSARISQIEKYFELVSMANSSLLQ